MEGSFNSFGRGDGHTAQNGATGSSSQHPLTWIGSGPVFLPSGEEFLRADFQRAGPDLVIKTPSAAEYVVPGYFLEPEPPALETATGKVLNAKTVAALAGPSAPAQVAQLAIEGAPGGIPQPDVGTGEPIGQVSEVEGPVVVTRADGTQETLGLGGNIFQGDVLETGAKASIGVVFVDDTVFTLDENGRMIMDEMVYDPGSQTGVFNAQVVQGVFSFVSGKVAKTAPDGMVITTPTNTIGIRGSTLLGHSRGEGLENKFVLVPDVDGHVGEVVISNAFGSQVLNQPGASVSLFSFNAPPPPPVIIPAQQIQQTFGASLTKLTKVVAAKAQQDAQRAENEASQKGEEAQQARADAQQADADAAQAEADAEQAQADAEAAQTEAQASGDEQAMAEAQAKMAAAAEAAAKAEAAKAEAEAQAAAAAAKAAEAQAAAQQAQAAQQFQAVAQSAFTQQTEIFEQFIQTQPQDQTAPGDGGSSGDMIYITASGQGVVSTASMADKGTVVVTANGELLVGFGSAQFVLTTGGQQGEGDTGTLSSGEKPDINDLAQKLASGELTPDQLQALLQAFPELNEGLADYLLNNPDFAEMAVNFGFVTAAELQGFLDQYGNLTQFEIYNPFDYNQLLGLADYYDYNPFFDDNLIFDFGETIIAPAAGGTMAGSSLNTNFYFHWGALGQNAAYTITDAGGTNQISFDNLNNVTVQAHAYTSTSGFITIYNASTAIDQYATVSYGSIHQFLLSDLSVSSFTDKNYTDEAGGDVLVFGTLDAGDYGYVVAGSDASDYIHINTTNYPDLTDALFFAKGGSDTISIEMAAGDLTVIGGYTSTDNVDTNNDKIPDTYINTFTYANQAYYTAQSGNGLFANLYDGDANVTDYATRNNNDNNQLFHHDLWDVGHFIGSTGDDYINVGTTYINTLETGDGDDTIMVNSDAARLYYIYAGAHNDTVTLTNAQFQWLEAYGLDGGAGTGDILNVRVYSGDAFGLSAYVTGFEVINIQGNYSASAGIDVNGLGISNAITFTGSPFADTLKGGSGNDTINGGYGQDTMTGNGGNNLYVYNDALESVYGNADSITDFDAGTNATWMDRIDISNILQGTFNYVGTGAFNADGNNTEARFDTGTNSIQVDLNADGAINSSDLVITVQADISANLDSSDFVTV